MSAALPLLIGLLLPVAQAEAEREEELFGAPTPSNDTATAPEPPVEPASSGQPDGSTPETALFGAPASEETSAPAADRSTALEERLSGSLDAQQDWLDLGGLLYSRLEYNAVDEMPAEKNTWHTPTLLDVYFDGRPNDRVRAYARGRLSYDATVREGALNAYGAEQVRTQVLLDQLWLKFDILKTVFLTIGKQPIRWGSGRFWNPTDFLNRQKRDPLAIIDERNGVSAIKLHLPLEALGWNLYAVANLEEAENPKNVGGAIRAELLGDQTELALTYAARNNNPHQLGIDISTGVWLFDLRAELAAQKGVETPFYRGPFDVARLQLPREVTRSDDWILQGTAALELTARYSDQDTVTVGVEYFYNDAGYPDAHLYPWLALNNRFTPLYLGRHYAGGYLLLPRPGLWNNTSFTLSGLANLSDESYLARFDYAVRLLTFIDLNLYASYHFGESGELHYSYSLAPVPVEGLENGFEINAPMIDICIALRVAL